MERAVWGIALRSTLRPDTLDGATTGRMKINFFEGARRIGRLLQVAWVVGCAVFVWDQKPHVSLTYSTVGPSAPFVAVTGCGTHDASEHRWYYKLDADRTASVTLCFAAMRFPNQEMLIPFKEDGGRWWGDNKFSPDATRYMERRAEQFALAEADRKAAIEEWRKSRQRQLWSGFGFAVGGAIAIWIVSAIIGWIVRGFFGIPSGRDSRPAPPEPKQSAASA
jgi:hypothetical protein